MTLLEIVEPARTLLDRAGRCAGKQEVKRRRATGASIAKRTTKTTRALHPTVHSAFSPSLDSSVRVDLQSL